MKTRKRAKKPTRAVTLLTKIERLLSDVLKEGAALEKGFEKNVRALLRTAETSVTAARDYFVKPAPAKVARKAAKPKAAKRVVTAAKAKTKAKAKAKAKPVAAAKKPAPRVVAAPRPEVILPVPLTPPAPPATPPVITAL